MPKHNPEEGRFNASLAIGRAGDPNLEVADDEIPRFWFKYTRKNGDVYYAWMTQAKANILSWNVRTSVNRLGPDEWNDCEAFLNLTLQKGFETVILKNAS